jgi:hypothetical protein
MKIVSLMAAIGAALLLTVSGAIAETTNQTRIRVAEAGSCSGWKAICESRGGGCDSKFNSCLSTGCWTEAPRYGGGRHCGLAKR